jgi:hypothetical protein
MQLFIVLVFLVVAGVIALVGYLNSDKYAIRKSLEATPRTSIRALQDGSLAKVHGKVVPIGEPLEAPLSGRACVAWEVVVEENTGGKNSHWVERIHEREARDFLLDDGAGLAHVRTRDMKMVATVDSEQRSGFMNDPTPALRAFLEARGFAPEGMLFNKSLRYREGVFEPGERVAVLGSVTMEDDPTREQGGDGYRSAPKRACLQAPANGFLLASDEPRSTGA